MDTKRLCKTADNIEDKTETFLLSLRGFIFIIVTVIIPCCFSLVPWGRGLG
jgi:hypothetical protein